jgi:hypothetical protein
VTDTGKIEDCSEAFSIVDFANQFIGGLVMTGVTSTILQRTYQGNSDEISRECCKKRFSL